MKLRLWILLVIVAVCAIPAFGQFQQVREIGPEDGGGWSGSSTYSNGQYMDNPCTAIQDWVWVNYQAYVDGAQAEAGVDRYLFDESTTLAGAYAATGSSSSDVEYWQQVSLRKYHKVNTPDDFHVVTVITFNPATKTPVLTVETACGDGSPDSKE